MKTKISAFLDRVGLHNASRPRLPGFTLAELLGVLAVLTLLGLVVAPVLARTKPNSQAFRCLNNIRQVMNAMTLYTADNHDLFPPNPDDGTTSPGYMWCSGQAGVGGAEEFNPDILRDPKRTLVAPYLNSDVSVFHCTADYRTGLYTGSALYPGSPLKGTIVPAARSISMNQAVGTTDPLFASGAGHAGPPILPVNGPWLTGTHGANSALTGPWRTYGKISQIIAPVPSKLFILIEEDPNSINDGGLAMSVGTPTWIDYPSTQHSLGCSIAFADGHVELRQWVNSNTVLDYPNFFRPLGNDTNDWSWLAQRTSARLR